MSWKPISLDFILNYEEKKHFYQNGKVLQNVIFVAQYLIIGLHAAHRTKITGIICTYKISLFQQHVCWVIRYCVEPYDLSTLQSSPLVNLGRYWASTF
jgi:hypothetical protein